MLQRFNTILIRETLSLGDDAPDLE